MAHNKEERKKAWKETGKNPFMKIITGTKKENISDIAFWNCVRWGEVYDRSGSKKKIIICADERVLPDRDEFKIGIAGQLILTSDKDKQSFIKRWKNKIKAVRSHDGCGAAAIAFGKLPKNKDKKIADKNINQADLCGRDFAKKLAGQLKAEFYHLAFTEMSGHKDFHDARILFWIADPRFDPSTLKENCLPPHFLANGMSFGLSKVYCCEELKILTGIALGEHGFGKLFNAENPFYVISVGKNKKEAVKLNNLAKKILKGFGKKISFRYLNR